MGKERERREGEAVPAPGGRGGGSSVRGRRRASAGAAHSHGKRNCLADRGKAAWNSGYFGEAAATPAGSSHWPDPLPELPFLLARDLWMYKLPGGKDLSASPDSCVCETERERERESRHGGQWPPLLTNIHMGTPFSCPRLLRG
ncbi:hypothetical protein XELAEV_18030090mg [Xenopus laevis]|uniref:Uncharacterized protein n=1 Tax=Xenopus laevis TaxID=8355 RepID=A0A974CUK1_XENLA|nr:hypothetical protein XELAEV_18030090mg [Xenopus laevis]